MFRTKAIPLAISALAAGVSLSTSAMAQSEDDYSFLEEVVVTAQFIEQSAQDTPLALTAMSGETLEARGHISVQDISAQAPNVTLTPGGSFAGPSLIGFIRGVGQTDFNPAVEPGVGMYVDDIYYATLTGSVLDLLDLERVEVLRGPQGTLNGKNSIGGSIKLYSKKPDADANGYVEIGKGSFNSVNVRAASNFTLIEDTLYGRLSGVSKSQDGYVKRVDYGCSHPDSVYGANQQGPDCVIGTEGGIDYTAGRLSLRWLPSDSLEINLSGDWLDDSSEAAPNTLLAVSNTIAPAVDPTTGLIWPNFAIPGTSIEAGNTVGCMFIAYGSSSCDPNSPNDPYLNYSTYTDPRTGASVTPEQRLESTGLSLNVDWQLSDSLQFQSITGHREYESGFGNDPDGSPLPVQMLYQVLRHEQTSQEFRFNGQVGDFADYTVGAFLFDQKTEMDARVNLGYVGFDFIHGPDPVNVTNNALFANTILHFTDSLDLALGLRYTEDEKEYTFARRNPDLSAIEECDGPPGTLTNPPNCLISSLNGATDTFSDERLDYRAALSFKLTDSILSYAQYSTGYKGGGVNPRPFYDVQVVSFNPEELETFEVGFKADLLDGRMRLNGAIFNNDYSDVQLTNSDCTPQFGPVFGRPCLAILNSGKAESQGYELEFDYSPIDGLLVEASYSYIDFEFTEIAASAGLPADAVTPYTPEVTWSFGLQYDVSFAKGTLSPRIDVNYQDDIFVDPAKEATSAIESYTLTNASITWLSEDEDWRLALKVRNATDELYYRSGTDAVASGGGSAYFSPGLPRTWEISAKRMF